MLIFQEILRIFSEDLRFFLPESAKLFNTKNFDNHLQFAAIILANFNGSRGENDGFERKLKKFVKIGTILKKFNHEKNHKN